jgi:hypothetical protein
MLGLPVLAMALWILLTYQADPGALWRDPYHDRNSHFAAGLDIALALRAGDAGALLAALGKASVWPPLQALGLGVWMAMAGPELRWAVLPAVLGWAVAVLGLWPLCRVASGDRARGDLAAAVAIPLALASPGFWRLGGDAMMETPGAALTVLVLVVALRRPLPWRALALLLTLLAFQKYNYWAMAVASLLLSEPRAVLGWARGVARTLGWPGLLRDPLPRAAALLLGIATALLPNDPPLRVGGFQLLPASLAALAWGLAVLAAARAWRRRSAAFDAAFGAPARILLAWHALPLALWFMIPGKLAAMLWFLAPTHRGATPPHTLGEAVALHWEGFAAGFAPHPLVAAGVLLLALAGMMKAQRLLGIFAALGVAALLLHPQLQWRFQATVLPAVWALAGLGAATLLGTVVPAKVLRWTPLALPVPLMALLLALPAAPLADAVAIRRPDAPRDLDLAAAWAALPVEPQGVLVLASFGRSDLFDWTLRLRCRCRAPIEQPPWLEQGDAAAAQALATTPARWLLAVDAPAPYPLAGRTAPLALPVAMLLAAQDRFARDRSFAVPAHGAEVAFWLDGAAAAPPPAARRRYVTEIAAALLALAVIATMLWPMRRRP